MTENQISEKITCCTMEVHKSPGPGLFENAYPECPVNNLWLCGSPRKNSAVLRGFFYRRELRRETAKNRRVAK